MATSRRKTATVKHVQVSQLGEEAKNVSVNSDWTIETMASNLGYDLSGYEVNGVDARGRTRKLEASSSVNGFVEFIFIPNVKGGQ